AQRRPPRPGRHVRALLHLDRQPQRGRGLLLPRARRPVRPGQGHQRPRGAQGDLPGGLAPPRGQRRLGVALHELHLHRHRPRGQRVHPDGQRFAEVPARDHRRRLMIARHPLLRRVLEALATLLGVAVLVFVMLRAIPGDQVTASLGTEAAALTPAQRAALEAYYGLDQPLPVQFLSWLGAVATGNLGASQRTGESVLDMTASALPITLELAVLSLLIGLVLGIAAAMLS